MPFRGIYEYMPLKRAHHVGIVRGLQESFGSGLIYGFIVETKWESKPVLVLGRAALLGFVIC